MDVIPGTRCNSVTKYALGADLGQSMDPTALAVLEHTHSFREWAQGGRDQPEDAFHVRHLQRLPLGLSYPTVVAEVARLLARPPLVGNCELIIDATGCGRPVADLFDVAGLRPTRVTITKFDPNDTIGFLRRQELRSVLRSMNADQRAMHLNDPQFCDAMLELPSLASGLFLAEDFKGPVSAEIQRDRDIVAAAKEKRLAGMFAPQLAEIAELEGTVAEANMIANIARNDLQATSGLEPAQFNEFVRPVEVKQNAPWLRKYVENGVEVIRVVDLENHVAKIATEDQVRDGVFFQNLAEYQAARAA